MNIVLQIFTGILAKLDGNTVKKVLDAGLDIIEKKIAENGVTNTEQIVLSAIDFLRTQLGIEEGPNSPFGDK